MDDENIQQKLGDETAGEQASTANVQAKLTSFDMVLRSIKISENTKVPIIVSNSKSKCSVAASTATSLM